MDNLDLINQATPEQLRNFARTMVSHHTPVWYHYNAQNGERTVMSGINPIPGREWDTMCGTYDSHAGPSYWPCYIERTLRKCLT